LNQALAAQENRNCVTCILQVTAYPMSWRVLVKNWWNRGLDWLIWRRILWNGDLRAPLARGSTSLGTSGLYSSFETSWYVEPVPTQSSRYHQRRFLPIFLQID